MAIYLQLDGVKGDATHQNHSRWTDIREMDWHVDRVINTPTGATTNRHDGGIEVGDVILTKTADASSVHLKQMALCGKKSGTAKIHLVASGNPGNTFLEYTLSNVLVSGYHLAVEHDRPIERINLNFTRMEMKYIPYDSQNQPQAPQVAAVDFAKLSGAQSSPHTRHARRERRKAVRDKVRAHAGKTGRALSTWQTIPEVDIGSGCGIRIVGFPDAAPLMRPASGSDDRVYATFYQMFRVCPDVAKKFRNYCEAQGLACPATGLAAEAMHAADLTAMGLIGVRGSGLPSVLIPAGSFLNISPQGRRFIYERECQKGVSERLYHPSAASGVTLGPGYDMRSRSGPQIAADLTAIGVDSKTAEAMKEAGGMIEVRATNFCREHHNLIVLSDQQQMALLQRELPDHIQTFTRALSPSVRQRLFTHEFEALASFFYNLGPSGAPSLMNALNRGDLNAAADLFSNYVYSGKERMAGLVNRRGLEKTLFREGRYA